MNDSYRPKKPVENDWHPADIKAALEKRGWSLRKLSVHHGLSPHTLRTAILRPYPRAETIIARVIGREPHQIWPSRYDGRRPRRRRTAEPPGTENPADQGYHRARPAQASRTWILRDS